MLNSAFFCLLSVQWACEVVILNLGNKFTLVYQNQENQEESENDNKTGSPGPPVMTNKILLPSIQSTQKLIITSALNIILPFSRLFRT